MATLPSLAAVKRMGGRWRKGTSIRAARIRRLRERLEVEADPKVRAAIEAQLVALAPRQLWP